MKMQIYEHFHVKSTCSNSFHLPSFHCSFPITLQKLAHSWCVFHLVVSFVAFCKWQKQNKFPMPPTHTHTSLLCRKQHSLFNYSWNGQLMPPHKTSRAHICSAFNQCVSPLPQIALPAAPFSLVLFSRSLSIVIPIHSTPFPFPIPFTLSSSSSLSSSSFTLRVVGTDCTNRHLYHVPLIP